MSDKKNEATGKAFELYDLRKEIMNIDYSLQLVSKNCNTLNWKKNFFFQIKII